MFWTVITKTHTLSLLIAFLTAVRREKTIPFYIRLRTFIRIKHSKMRDLSLSYCTYYSIICQNIIYLDKQKTGIFFLRMMFIISFFFFPYNRSRSHSSIWKVVLSNSEGALKINKNPSMRNSLNDTTQTRKHSTAIITIQKSIIQRFAFKFNHIKLLYA